MTGPDNTEFDDLDDLKAAMTAATPAPTALVSPRRSCSRSDLACR